MTLILDGTLGASAVQPSSIQTDDLAPLAVTGPKMAGNQTGNPPVYGIRAWARLNGITTGTNAPIAGGNVSTIQRVSLGVYAALFTVPMPDANYGVTGSASTTTTSDTRGGVVHPVDGTLTTSGFTFVVSRNGDTGAGPVLQDNSIVTVFVMR